MKIRKIINRKRLITELVLLCLMLYCCSEVYAGHREVNEDMQSLDDKTLSLGIRKVDSGDILFTEILPKVEKGQAEFIEVYNASEYGIALSDLYLGLRDVKTNSWKLYDVGGKSSFVLASGEYYVLSKAPESIGRQYRVCEEDNFIKVSNLPPLTDGGGYLAILRKKDTLVLEQMQYSERMHHPLLDNTVGVSLERMRMEVSAMCFENWHSAAQAAAYGTPSCENSQGSDRQDDEEEQWFRYSSDFITPNNDGLNDYLRLEYNLKLAGYICSIRIYDSEGRLCRLLVNQTLLGREDFLLWDGFDDKKRRLRSGMYIVFIELIHTNGKRKVLRKAIGVA